MISTFGGNEDHPQQFIEAFKHPDKPVNWDSLYEGFDAAVDWYVMYQSTKRQLNIQQLSLDIGPLWYFLIVCLCNTLMPSLC